MIAIDTSAICAILQDEPERIAFNGIVGEADEILISAATLLETRIVLQSRFGESAISDLDSFLLKSGIEIADVTTRQDDIAFSAFRKYGKGTGHPAGLNFGDCFSYALAKDRDIPLLYKGGDFPNTDIEAAANKKGTQWPGFPLPIPCHER